MNVSGHLFIRGREAGWQHAGKQLFHDIPPFLSRILLIIKGRQRKGKYRICSEIGFFAEGSLRCYDTGKKKTRKRERKNAFPASRRCVKEEEKMMNPVKTGVIGCGAISDIYLQNMMNRFGTQEVLACSAGHRENAERKAAQYGIRAADTSEMLADPEIEMAVVLTPAPTHYELVMQALQAGKHVYLEKPIATGLSRAKEMIALAGAKGLLLATAPETFLGSAVQTARKALDEGMIGEVTSFHIVANRDLTMLASIFKFLRLPGGGICYDYGVYYLTALCSLLGPMEKVYAQVGNHCRVRKNVFPQSPEFGQDYVYDNESQVNAVLTTKSGIAGTFSLNGDSAAADQGMFTIHGTKGILRLGDANQFGGTAAFLPNDFRNPEWKPLEPVSPLSDNCRGIGAADLARCIREGGKPAASAEMACHVLDIAEKMMESGNDGTVHWTETTCDRPVPFDRWQQLMKNRET